MDTCCPECGAPLSEEGSCRDHFHALLVLEGTSPGAPGSILHFYAVASYNLQHPHSAGLTAAALTGLYESLTDALEGSVTLDALRRRVQRVSNGPTRVLRRPEQPVPDWHLDSWPMTVVDVLESTADTYPDLVVRWARAVRESIASSPYAHTRRNADNGGTP